MKWKVQLDNSKVVVVAHTVETLEVLFREMTNDQVVQHIEVEPYAVVTVREICGSGIRIAASTVEIIVGSHAQVTYQLGSFDALGMQLIKRSITFVLQGDYGQVECFGALQARGAVKHELQVKQIHQGISTKSSCSVKMVLDDAVQVIYAGRVLIEPSAHKASAIQDYKALVLSEAVVVTAKPELEILHNNVACKHGVAIAHINKEYIFYLATRGIPREIGVELITQGFLR